MMKHYSKRVLHLHLMGGPGGVISLCNDIARHSENINYNYFLFEGGTVAESMRQAGIPVVVSYTSRFFWKASIDDLISYCKKENIDVLINHLNSPISITHTLAVKKSLPNVKVLMYLHSDALDMLAGRKKYILPYFVNKLEKKADNVLAISEFVKARGTMYLKIPSNHISVVYNGVDCDKFKYRSDFKTPSSFRLIFVGRLIKTKGVHLLLEAINKLSFKNEIEVDIVGYGVEEENLKELSKNLKLDSNVRFLGSRMDIPELLEKSCFFVHPAYWGEGFGITLVEAMAVGLPCIAFDKGAMPEIIKPNINGYLATPDSVDSLAEKITMAYDVFYNREKYVQMSREARKTAERFNIDRMVKELESFY